MRFKAGIFSFDNFTIYEFLKIVNRIIKYKPANSKTTGIII